MKSQLLGAVCAVPLAITSLSANAVVVPPLPGDLLISELMANPDLVTDAAGEWFEIFNASVNDIDLNGLNLNDDGSDFHTINAGGPLIVTSGDYFVFGRNGASNVNGGYTADYVYSNFSLSNTVDEIVISDSVIEFARLDYDTPFTQANVSEELTLDGTYITTPSNFVYGIGMIGTPGAPGSSPLSAVPLPPAVWLFGSGLLGLVGISRRKKSA